MADVLYETTWGRIRLFCARIETDNSRTQVIHQPAVGDVAQVQDRGLAPRKTRCELLFDDFPGESKSALERFRLFKGQVDRGDEELFTHPVDGAYIAKVGDFHYTIDDDSNITDCSCEFIASDDVIAIHPAAAGTPAPSGVDSVDAAAGILKGVLEAADISSDLPDRATAMVDAWTADDPVPTRDVLNQTAALSDELGTLIEEQGLEDDLDLFDAWKAAIMFGNAIRDAAASATSEASSIFVMRVNVPTSILALVVRVYGGAEADDRERQVRALNDLRTPGGLIEAGTDIVMPTPGNRRAA